MKFFVLETYMIDTNDLHDVFFDVFGYSVDEEVLKEIFDECPGNVKADSYYHGSSDTCFREKFWMWLSEQKTAGKNLRQLRGFPV